MVEKNCEVCQKPFKARSEKTRFCSNWCKGRAFATDPDPIIELWKEGLSCYEISQRLEIGYHSVEHVIKGSGLFEHRYATNENGKHSRDGGRPFLFGYRKKRANPDKYRDIAFDAHGARCSVCGYDSNKSVLEVHHKDSDRENVNPENLVVLCPTHHAEKHYNEKTGPWYRSPLPD